MTDHIDFNDPEIQKLLARVDKLLALAANNPNEAEAASAAAKAQDLLAAYQLDMSALELADGKKHGRREEKKLKGGLYQWQRDLWHNVAQLNFCLYWFIRGLRKGTNYQHRLIGRTSNVVGTKLMAEYLEQAIERIARDHYDNNPSRYFSKAGIAFREGMSARICQRLRDRRREQIEEDRRKAAEQKARASHPASAPSTSTALTVVDVTRTEHDANAEFEYDLQNGPGEYARMMKLRVVYRAEQQAEQDAIEAERLAWIAANPEEHARREAAKAEQERKDAEREARREARNAKRRKGTERPWKSGVRHDDYFEGLERGDDVSLDQQIGNRQDRRIA